MTEPVELPFVMNQSQIDAAIVQEMPRLLKGLKLDYTSGRAPRGLSAQVTINEETIRAAILGHSRKLVNPMFNHFKIDFVATRGEDGITANIMASTAPIDTSAPVEAVATETVVEAVAAQETTDTSSEEQTGEANEAEAVEAVDTADVKPVGGARSRLFADLKRPSNADVDAALVD